MKWGCEKNYGIHVWMTLISQWKIYSYLKPEDKEESFLSMKHKDHSELSGTYHYYSEIQKELPVCPPKQ